MDEPPNTVPATDLPDDEAALPTPRWVKLFGLVGALLLLLFVVVHIATGGMPGHG